MKRFAVILTMMVVMSGCSVTRYVEMGETYEKEFIGMDRAYVEYVCGTPSSVERNGGGDVLIYEDMVAFGAKTGYDDVVVAPGKSGVVAEGYVQMFFGTDGLCYSVRTNHTKAVRETDATRTWATVASCAGGATFLGLMTMILINVVAR